MTGDAEDMAAASVPVASVVTGDGVRMVADLMLVRAYRTRAVTGMHLTAPQGRYKGTVKGFNELTGSRCRNWAEVAVAAFEILNRGE